ncbi:hypothetical protein B0T16DRAFT_392383 [Cercophora newfieldiana]|uniref:NTF2-like domain-containing protein n=1 Tax=Cercophora newfieldiana TaxID=92897 RepID=A0AA39Y116_9PEZI|nr:hypothetical protein B0T16DRAFT_392383 [Cercophora newfieldiana]
MRFFTALTFAATAAAAAVGTTSIKRNGLEVRVATEPKKCLCKSDVDELTAVYAQMLDNWDDSLIKYLHEDFLDWSESIAVLIPNGPPLGVPIFTKDTFIDHQHTQPDDLPVIIEKLGPWNCNALSFVWHATFKKFGGQTEKKVRGVTIIEVEKVEGQWQFKNFDVEFNNINYNLAIGGTVTGPAPPPAPAE